ncbi:hypothetical protein M422DRAFT_272212 [Sphaerobolus stellatus SS14]|uniref:Uncharacterized protein n=1 Tax=Sphaerobolus stellatus (strain SS14) TaxID=990650 RepID=A0A0C9TC14_SPHS4|nr:hypothetical protein M422DRAFT_272212 [Sphaerobolus stellatus SS14]
MFSYEVILAHILGEMTADWRSKTLNDYAYRLASIRHPRQYPNAGQLSVHNASDRAIFNEVYKEIGYDTDLKENDWVTIHKNAVHTLPHTTMHYVHGVELIKIEEDGNILEPDVKWIEGDREKLTEEETMIVFVGALEKKKKEKKKKEKKEKEKETTKEKGLPQQELPMGDEGSVQVTSPLSSTTSPLVRGSDSAGGGEGSARGLGSGTGSGGN